jgi:hypothetical protein
MPKPPHPDKLLSIYLNDHLAGSTAGVQLARRLHASNRDDPSFGAPLADVRAEVETDLETLKEAMQRLGVSRSSAKPAVAWIGERLGRLKPNGQLTGYSPLSRVVELELLLIGITGKKRMWSVVEQTHGAGLAIDFGRLIDRAERQRTRVAELHAEAAAIAFAPTDTGPVDAAHSVDSVDAVEEAAVAEAAE